MLKIRVLCVLAFCAAFGVGRLFETRPAVFKNCGIPYSEGYCSQAGEFKYEISKLLP